MKKSLPLTCLLLTLGATAPLCAAPDAAPSTQKEKLSYALGMNFAQKMKSQGVEIDPAMFNNAVRDVLAGGKLQMTQDQTMEVFQQADKDMQAKQAATMKPLMDKNKAEGATYLTANKAKTGVQTLPSGLQYKVLAEGKGNSPKSSDSVTVKIFRHPDRRQAVRQLRQAARRHGQFSGHRRDSRLDRGAPEDEARLQVAALHSV